MSLAASRAVTVAIALLAPGAAAGQELPPCANTKIQEVVRRAGCTLGDDRCWVAAGGFCTDWIERRILERSRGVPMELVGVEAHDVRPGDVAVFYEAPHYAWIERVARDAEGRPVAVDLSEYNFGTCWVDDELMVTDRFKLLSRRAAVPLSAIDGGFRRARPLAAP